MQKYLLLFSVLNFLSCEDKNEDCSVSYATVCGSNKITFDNDRYARNAGISEWVEGECDFTDES
tara:strand:+ start:224 stop:415 length:192 start_codon:yes stop_codon:yes gene_type:complete